MSYFTDIANKMWPKKIRSQLILGIVFVHLLLMGIFVYDMTNRQKEFLKEQHLEQTISMVSEYALNAKNYIIIHDLDGLERLTLAQNNFPKLKYAMVLSPEKDVLTHTNKNYIGTKPNDDVSLNLKNIPQTQVLLENYSILDIASPIMQDNKIIGWARVGIGQEYIQENLAGIVRKGILYMVIALVIGFFVAISVGNRLNKGLYALIDTTDKIKEGDRKLRVSPFQTFEISRLGTAFNQMLDEISTNEKLLAMVMENLPVGVFILNDKGEINSVNPAGKEIWKDVKYIGPEKYGEYKAWFTNTNQLVKPDEWGAAIVLTTGNPVLNQEMAIECFDGSKKTILNSAIPLKDDNEKIIGVITINIDISDRKKAEAVILKTNHDIGERVKELTCLYYLTKLVNDPEKSMVDILQGCVNIIPPSYQYPEVTTARIFFGDQTFESPVFSESVWKQEAFITSHDSKIGLIEIFYTSEMPDEQEGPFLKEERDLINSIADIIGSAAERRKAEIAIKEQAETFEAIIENTKESIYLISPDYKLLQFNKTARERMRFSRNIELKIGIDFREAIFPQAIDLFISMFEDALKGISRTEEKSAQGISGEYFWFQAKTSPVHDPNGKLIGVTLLTESINERKKAEAFIKQQAETFQAIIENTKESIYLISPDYKILQFNKIARERIRKSRGVELYIGLDFREFLFPDSADIFYSMFEDALKGISRTEEIQGRGISGEILWFQSKTSPVYDPAGKLIGVTMLAEGIDDRKKAEAELRESEEKFRSLVEQSLVGVYIIQNNTLVYVNPGFEKIFDYTKEQLINKMSFEGFIHEDDLGLIRKNYSLRMGGQVVDSQYVFRGFKSDGSILYLEVIASVIVYNGAPAIIGTLIDITGRMEEEKRIGKAVNEAQENERIQIGMELHDNVKQMLAASVMSLGLVKYKFNNKEKDDKEGAIEIVNTVIEYIMEAVNELRRLSHQLAPTVDREETLAEKIEKLANLMNRDEHWKVHLNIDEFEQPLNDDIQIAFYRILQEQLNNILKYAKASSVFISIKPDDKNVYLIIKDDGKGFNTTSKKEGIGLENIKRRATVLGGQVKVISSPGNGCELNVEIPLN